VASAGLYANLHLIPDNHANIPPLSFLQAGCPSCHPTNSVKALKAINKKLKERSWPKRKENEVALQRAEMRMIRWMEN